MVNPRNEFTNITSLKAEALGQPGKRTFRVLVESGSSSAVVWLEKEQLFHLALAIHRLVAMVPEDEEAKGTPPFEREVPGLTRLDFKAGKLVLDRDSDSGLFVIDAHDIVDDEDAPAKVRVWADRSQVTAFAQQALEVCAAGRPICPLCGRPIDPTGHACPRVNGHAKAVFNDV